MICAVSNSHEFFEVKIEFYLNFSQLSLFLESAMHDSSRDRALQGALLLMSTDQRG